MTDRTTELESALAEVCAAALKQLRGMGKGRDPSPRLQTALDEASRLLGRDVTETPKTEFDRELGELRAFKAQHGG